MSSEHTRKKTKAHRDANNKTESKSLIIDQIPRQQCLQVVLEGMRSNHKLGYTVEIPSPWWTLGFPTSAHINKLMIIAKGENHTHNTQASRNGKLE